MNSSHHEILRNVVARLVEKPKGILAIDEGLETCNARFAELGIDTTVENRRAYREILVTTPDIETCVSGYILFDETIHQSTGNGWRFADILHDKGIEIGIKVDQGLEPFGSDGEQVTKGLDGLTERLIEYRDVYGASFTKWRAVVHIGSNVPTDENLTENAHRLADYAVMVQDAGMVPIIEPEVLMTGDHTIQQCYDTTVRTLRIVFATLHARGVWLPGVILKTGMVISGDACPVQADTDTVARMTLQALHETVPVDIGGIVFLSGGQDSEHAAAHLARMHIIEPDMPWPLTFSYGRAIQQDALEHFAGNPTDTAGAQVKLLTWARADSRAVMGE